MKRKRLLQRMERRARRRHRVIVESLFEVAEALTLLARALDEDGGYDPDGEEGTPGPGYEILRDPEVKLRVVK